MTDRLQTAFRASQSHDPMIRYGCIYRARVTGQSGDLQRVHVKPFDPTLPEMADIPLRHGVPGIKVQVTPGCSVQIGWDDRRPDRPFAALWSADASAVRIVLDVPSLELGNEQPADFAVKGTSQVSVLAGALTTIAGALFSLGKFTESASVAAAAAQLPGTLSTRVRIGG